MPLTDPRQSALKDESFLDARSESYTEPMVEAAQRRNPFTPIKVPETLRSARVIVNRPLASLPPKPGQLYAYDVDRSTEDPDDHAAAAQGYQQAYWQTVREVAPEEMLAPPTYPPCPLPPMRPPVLYDEQAAEPGAHAPIYQPDPEGYRAAFSAGSYERASEQPVYGGGQSAREYAPEEPPQAPYYGGAPEWDMYKGGERQEEYKPTLRERAGTMKRRISERRAQTTPLRTALTLAVCLCIIACIVIMADLVGRMQLTERENKQWRESYYGTDAGNEIGSLVKLPQGGATFAPTLAPTEEPKPEATQQPETQASEAPVEASKPTAAPSDTGRTARREYTNNPQLTISERFQSIRKENRFVVGWLDLGELSCPVMQHAGKDFYQSRNAQGQYSKDGAIYIEPTVNLKTPPENLIVFGNNNATGTMFAHLAKYESAEHAQRNPYISLDTIYEDGEFVIFAVIRADTDPASADYFNFAGYGVFPTDKAFLSYISAARRRSLFDISVDAAVGDELLTLCTQAQTGGTKRLVVLCRRLREGESAETLPVTITMKKESI